MECFEYTLNEGQQTDDLGNGMNITSFDIETGGKTVTLGVHVKGDGSSIWFDEGGEYEGVSYQATVHACDSSQSGTVLGYALLAANETATFGDLSVFCGGGYLVSTPDGLVPKTTLKLSGLPWGYKVNVLEVGWSSTSWDYVLVELRKGGSWLVPVAIAAAVGVAFVAGMALKSRTIGYAQRGLGYAGERLSELGKRP